MIFSLDKLVKDWYNTRIGFKERNSTMKVTTKELKTFNKEGILTDNVDRVIRNLFDAFYEETQREGLGKPIIAGGAVRDILYGFTPKDYDVFIAAPDDAPFSYEDNAELIAWNAYATLGKDWKDEGDLALTTVDYGQGDSGRNFATLQMNINGIDYDCIYEEGLAVLPETLIETFDHDLVRCYFDGENYCYSPAFMRAYESKTVVAKDHNTSSRLLSWYYRTGVQMDIQRPYLKEVDDVTLTTRSWSAKDFHDYIDRGTMQKYYKIYTTTT